MKLVVVLMGRAKVVLAMGKGGAGHWCCSGYYNTTRKYSRCWRPHREVHAVALLLQVDVRPQISFMP